MSDRRKALGWDSPSPTMTCKRERRETERPIEGKRRPQILGESEQTLNWPEEKPFSTNAAA